MRRFLCLFFCALFALSLTAPTAAKRKFGGGSRHSYPSSSGLSGGGGRHSYPSSGGLSGGGHGYPSSGGSHAYPSSGGSHGYPSSGGLSGNSHGAPGSGGYPSSGGSSGYPSNTHHSSSHGYPAGKGLSGNANTGHTTNVHYHYNYNPPQQIRYAPVHGGAPVSYPVYHGSPPTYVYQYKDSGSKYGTLLAGLALLNLGTVAAGAYALSRNHQSYKPQPGEICKFGVRKDNGDYEETKIDCQLITSFIFQEEARTQQNSPSNATIITTTVTNVTTVNITNPAAGEEATSTTVKPLYEMLPNGTFVPVNGTAVNTTTTTNTTNDAVAPSTGNTMTSSVTVTTTNTTTVANALDVKGKPVEVTPVMISVCWVAGAGVGFLPLFGWHKVSPDFPPGCYFVEVMDYNYLLFLYFATIVTPSVLLAAFYAHIYRVVIKQMSTVVTVEGSQGRGGTMLRVLGAAQKREVKATQNLAIIVFFFIICWIPLYTMNAIKTFMPELDIPNTLTYFCIIFSHLNSAINPLLYAYHLKDFRAALKGLICTIFGRAVPIPAAYRPPLPVRRPALERCNALRPKVYVNSPVWLRQREAEMAAKAAKERKLASTSIPDAEPFLGRIAADGSSGRHSPEGRETNGPYLIESSQEKCQSPYKKVEDFLRRVRSVHSDHS